MKRTLLSVLIALAAIATAWPQATGRPFYLYRNDGAFNAFFSSEVDSITCSKTAADGTLCDDWVTQEIWTPDSVYRIPLASIDSVSFVQPETVYQNNVITLDSTYLPYIESVDGLNITFSSNLPPAMRPRSGDILITSSFDAPFPDGFSGRVTSVSGNYRVGCSDDVSLTDIYKQLVITGSSQPLSSNDTLRVDDSDNPNQIPSRINSVGEGDAYLPPFAVKVGSSSISVSPSVRLQYTICIQQGTQPVIQFILTHGASVTTHLKISELEFVNGEKRYWRPVEFTFPTPVPGLFLFVDLGAYFQVTGSVSLETESTTYSYRRQDICYYNRNTGKMDNVSRSLQEPSFAPPKATLEMEGSVGTGVALRFGAKIISKYISNVNLETTIGIKMGASFKLTTDGLYDGTLYSSLKDSKVSYDLEADLSLNASTLFNEIGKQSTFLSVRLWDKNLYSLYLLPEFGEPSYTAGSVKGQGRISTSISRDLISPCYIGMRLYDDDDNILETRYSNIEYRKAQEYTSPYREEFTDLQSGASYRVCPMVKLFGVELCARPDAVFSVDVLIETGSALNITKNSATCAGYVEGTSKSTIQCSYGICWSSTQTPTITSSCLQAGTGGDGTFSVNLSGLSDNTTYYYRAYLVVDGECHYGEVKSFTTQKDDDDITPGQAVDLGLSVKWATCNVGATKPEEYGGFYAWGETEEKSDYSEATYKYYKNGSYIDIGSNISGTEYDVAHVKWGAGWRMPTYAEQQELCNNCTWKWTTINGVKGMSVTGPNGNSIFLPAAGGRYGTDVSSRGRSGYYWSGSLGEDGSYGAWYLYFSGIGHYLYWGGSIDRGNGFSVCPVSP